MSPLDNAPNVLTVEDVVSITGLSQTTVLRWLKGNLAGTPKLPAVRIGRQWRIQRTTLERFLQSGSEAA